MFADYARVLKHTILIAPIRAFCQQHAVSLSLLSMVLQSGQVIVKTIIPFMMATQMQIAGPLKMSCTCSLHLALLPVFVLPLLKELWFLFAQQKSQ